MKSITNTESNNSDKFFRNAALVSGREWGGNTTFGLELPQWAYNQIIDQVKNKLGAEKIPEYLKGLESKGITFKQLNMWKSLYDQLIAKAQTIPDINKRKTVIAEIERRVNPVSKTALEQIGEAVTFPIKAATAVINTAQDLVEWVPIVGQPLSAVIRVPGLDAINKIVDGMPIDKAIISDFSNTVSSIKGVMPIASAISIFVPGLGIGIAAGLAGAKALIDKIPISPELIQAAVSVHSNVKDALELGLKVGGETAVNKDNVTAILNGINEDAKKALTVGVALGTAKRIEKKTSDLLVGLTYDEQKLNSMTQVGEKQVQRNSAYKAIADKLGPEERKGFVFALGLVTLKCTETAIKAARNSTAISPKGRIGFDMGLAAKIGSTTKPPVIDPKKQLEDIKKQAAADLARVKKEAVIDAARAAKNAQIAAEDNAKNISNKSKLQQRNLEIAAQDAKKKADRLAVKAKEAELEALANQEQAVQYATDQAKTTDVALTNAAYFITQGMKGASTESKVAQLNILMKDTASKLGADLVVEEVKVKKSLWGKLKSYFGFHGEIDDELT